MADDAGQRMCRLGHAILFGCSGAGGLAAAADETNGAIVLESLTTWQVLTVPGFSRSTGPATGPATDYTTPPAAPAAPKCRVRNRPRPPEPAVVSHRRTPQCETRASPDWQSPVSQRCIAAKRMPVERTAHEKPRHVSGGAFGLSGGSGRDGFDRSRSHRFARSSEPSVSGHLLSVRQHEPAVRGRTRTGRALRCRGWCRG